ncbi:Methyltransferase type 11 [Kribbella flavida DSM 17836]|uniref:Methyltransferase type 11 n=1 Tax=Kribbella flavida (strain DSM 17836 / JCM 10339 / NBRC 14399) TaxID=479435 RepID=D2PQ04_KRIFD|nr:class I SAM-dependent methyltransferase [Kribbella flavida]ADB32928.1 Methyltransferase type 11 [Kribbella flavida DSM 17836]
MTDTFDKQYWDKHWQERPADGSGAEHPPNPYLARELGELVPGSALDAGCGTGAEAIWLAEHGWQVTAVDISAEALARAEERSAPRGMSQQVRWVEADLSVWQPETQYDLVTTHYAHPAIPQLKFYDRIARWVAPGGTLLIVGHLHTHGAAGNDHGSAGNHRGSAEAHHHPAEASATAASVSARLNPRDWEIVTAEEPRRTLTAPGGREVLLHDVVVRATRRS